MKQTQNKKAIPFKKKDNESSKEKNPSVFDKAFKDPDSEKRRREREELIGPIEERTFSKSIDDEYNPKYGSNPHQEKTKYTDKEKQKYKERFPNLAKRQEQSDGRYDRKRDHTKDGSRTKREEYKKDTWTPRSNAKYQERKPSDRKYSKDATNDGDRGDKKYEDHKFKSKFTSFEEQKKVYVSRPTGRSKNKFDGRDKKLDEKLAADYNPEGKMPLNKYISRSGVCSRRNAVDIIKAGRVKVNNEIITEPGFKIEDNAIVTIDNKKIHIKEQYTYVLLNKPKGYITTLDDPKGRRIISELYQEDIQERIFPVGRLDRNTTGLILLTNDGDLSNQLAHPKYQIKKIYQVKLDKNVSELHMQAILSGLELEDGTAEVDAISYLATKDEIGIEIHSGKNRIVRRIFEHLGYTVDKLDRVLYAGLTKKNLPKGQWRLLSRQEIINLKHLNKKIK